MDYRIKGKQQVCGAYIAIISCVVMGMLLLSVVITQSASALFARMHALSFEYAMIRKEHARACAQIASLRLSHSLQTHPDSVYSGEETIVSKSIVCTIDSVIYKASKDIADITVSVFYGEATSTYLFSINTKLLIQ